MKKMLLTYCAGPANTGCAQQTFTVQNKPAVAPKETITHHFSSFFLELGEENCHCKICGGAENVVKTKPSKHS